VTFISEENDSIGFKIENATVRSLWLLFPRKLRLSVLKSKTQRFSHR